MEKIFAASKLLLLALLLFCFIIRLMLIFIYRQSTREDLRFNFFYWYTKIEIYSFGGKRRRTTMKRANHLNTGFWVIFVLLVATHFLAKLF
jgi:hypothetical protein